MSTQLQTSPLRQVFSEDEAARQIAAAHAQVAAHLGSAVAAARCAGELLLEVKRRVPHGSWLPWLEQHCPAISARTVRDYLRIARYFRCHPEELPGVAAASIRELLGQAVTTRIAADKNGSALPICPGTSAEEAALAPLIEAVAASLAALGAGLRERAQGLTPATAARLAHRLAPLEKLLRRQRRELAAQAKRPKPRRVSLVPADELCDRLDRLADHHEEQGRFGVPIRVRTSVNGTSQWRGHPLLSDRSVTNEEARPEA